MTFGLLLKPHLTSCCGNHLSHEAAATIRGKKGVCPLCKNPEWSTMLDKHFQRKVQSLHVFCHHKERGCGWQGEMADFERHTLSCNVGRSVIDCLPPEILHLLSMQSSMAIPLSLVYTYKMHLHYTTVVSNTRCYEC